MDINVDAKCECGADTPLKMTKILFCERMTVNHTLKAEFHAILECQECDRVHRLKVRNIDTHTIPESYTGIPIK